MTKDEFEQVLGYHAAPMLFGVKSSNLITFCKSRFHDFEGLLASYEPCFRCKGISFFRLSERDGRSVVLFYRADAMRHDLSRPAARNILIRYGYRIDGTLSELLRNLRRRVEKTEAFPHEIGLFLGYPPEDVEGFIRNQGRDYRCCGYWKVYSDERKARRLFDVYTRCSESFCRQLDGGRQFEELVRAV